MHILQSMGARVSPQQSAGVNAMSASANNGFQSAMPTANLASLPVMRFSTATLSLGAQTISTLLQTQDISQTGGHGGGGGGTHHMGLKMPSLAESEIASESEEAQILKQRKKLLEAFQNGSLSETQEEEEANTSEAANPLFGDADQDLLQEQAS